MLLSNLQTKINKISSFFFSSRRRHTSSKRDWSSDVCSSDLSRAHRRRHADRRSAADDHFADGLRDLTIIRVGIGNFLAGKAALVEHDHATIGPFDRLRYVHAFDVLTKLNCSEGGGGKRIAASCGSVARRHVRKALGGDDGSQRDHGIVAEVKK